MSSIYCPHCGAENDLDIVDSCIICEKPLNQHYIQPMEGDEVYLDVNLILKTKRYKSNPSFREFVDRNATVKFHTHIHRDGSIFLLEEPKFTFNISELSHQPIQPISNVVLSQPVIDSIDEGRRQDQYACKEYNQQDCAHAVSRVISHRTKQMVRYMIISICAFALAFLIPFVFGGMAPWLVKGALYTILTTAFICFFVFCYQLGERQKGIKELQMIKDDFHSYIELLRERDEAEKRQQEYAEYSAFSGRAKCPNCHSANIREISNVNRATSVAIWGLASSKIGKQYECTKCGHKW